MKTIVFNVEGMKCGGCRSKIENHLSEGHGLDSIQIDLEKKEVTVSGEAPSGMNLKKEIEDLGFSVAGMKKL